MSIYPKWIYRFNAISAQYFCQQDNSKINMEKQINQNCKNDFEEQSWRRNNT